MNKSIRHFAAILFIFIGFVASVDGKLRCYVCTTCDDGPNSYMRECDGPDARCFKTVNEIFGKKIVTKGCSSECTEGPIPIIGGQKYCCKGELCNDATTGDLNYKLLFPLLTFTFFTILFQ